MSLRFMLFSICLLFGKAYAAEHGEVSVATDRTYSIWNDKLKSWMDVNTFWQQYAKSKGGLTWGVSDTYPAYSKVKEGDTLMIKVVQGECLMEFFHERWRRANDVRRWDELLNDYSGCPHVFD